MSERHVIAGPPRGEPLPAGRVGIRARVPLSGTPSSAWSELFTASLTTRLVGHRGASHLQLAHVVQGGELVLEGVRDADASQLGSAIRAAIGTANAGLKRAERRGRPCNVDQAEADRIAGLLDLADDREAVELDAAEPAPEPVRTVGVLPPGGG